MKRKIKALGLALVAALALTAVMASTASANFTSTASHTLLFGSQVGEHTFTAGPGIGAITCKKATFNGTALGSFSSWKVKPIYDECKDSLGREVHVDEGATEYEFTSTAEKSLVHIVNGPIVLTVTGKTHCTITITSQQAKNKVSYAQEGNKLKVTTATDNVHSHIAGGGFACGTTNTTSATGTYVGTTLMEGNSGNAKISVH